MYYYGFFKPYLIANSYLKIICWTIYLIIILPLFLLIHLIVNCVLKKQCSKWFFNKALYSGTFLFFILTFSPFMAATLFEWRYNPLETHFEKMSFTFACVIGFVNVMISLILFFVVC